MIERWKPIARFNGYMVSNYGRVKSLGRVTRNTSGKPQTVKERFLKPYVEKSTGYPRVSLWADGSHTKIYIHTLVAAAFIPNPKDKPQVNHRDSNRTNNHANNLEWVTPLENIQHAMNNGRMIAPPIHIGESHPKTTLKETDIKKIRAMSTEGIKYPAIAKMFSVSSVTVGRIVRRVVWNHVD